MYRVFILSLVAIVFSSFAVDSSPLILQAKKISDSSISLSWTPIPESTQYKVFYDESDYLDPASPNLFQNSEFVEGVETEVVLLKSDTHYQFEVRGYNVSGKEMGKTLPLHAKTYTELPIFQLVGHPVFLNNKTLEIGFTRNIKLDGASINIKDVEGKGDVGKYDFKLSGEDLRVFHITFQKEILPHVPYEVSVKKIVALDGSELDNESHLPVKVVFSGEDSIPTTGFVTPPSPVEEMTDEVFAEPVPIDALPKTGMNHVMIILIALAVGLFMRRQKMV